MSESRSTKLVVVFIVAVVAFGIGSIAVVSKGGIFGLDLLNFNNNSSEDNASNPFAIEMTNESSDNSDSSNNYSSNDKKTNKNTDSSSNNGNNNNNDNEEGCGSEHQSESKSTKKVKTDSLNFNFFN